MKNQITHRLNFAKKAVLAVAGIGALAVPIGVGMMNAPSLRAQSPDVPDWQAAAGGKMAFEVASVKPLKPGGKDWRPRMPLFDLSNGNAVAPGGRFFADYWLWTYIQFAYKLATNQEEERAAVAQFPKGLSTELFEIEARASGNASKDQMRLMMQSLLADRFKLAVHFETHEVPVLALTLDKPGKLGPKLRPHSEGPACPEFKATEMLPPGVAPEPFKAGDAYPPQCYITMLTGERDGPLRLGSRDATLEWLADNIQSAGSLSGEIDKPVVDRTGLSGTFDFTVEYSRAGPGPGGTRLTPPGDNASPPPETTFVQAVRQQLGLKLVPSRAPIRTIIIDHVERPTEN